MALPIEEQYKIIFPEMAQDTAEDQKLETKSPFLYNLIFKDIAGFYQNCYFCDQRSCRGCPVPFDENVTLKDMMMRAGLEDNDNFYPGTKLQDIQVNVMWGKHFPIETLESYNSCKTYVQEKDEADKVQSYEEENITLEDCFAEFNKPQHLDQENMWYCWKCKEHRQATKYLQLYRAPQILIIALKRFKQTKNQSRFSYSYGYDSGGTDKLDTKVNFPIEGMDLKEHVLGYEGDQPLLYDLYAVSNHYGGLGGGHYTAYGKNPISGQWLYFDDGWVKPTTPEEAIDSAAYVLFYRRRGSPNMENVDLDAIKQSSNIQVEQQ